MFKMKSLLLVTLCFYLVTLSQFYNFAVSSKPTGFSLKLIFRDSPESPLYPGNLTYLERKKRLIRFSEVRTYYLENFSHPNIYDGASIDFKLPMGRNDLHYFVQIGIGSQELNVFLFLDTGSGLTWTQCEPCTNCYAQTSPRYNSALSDTYRKLPCDHPLCSGDYVHYRCVNGECVYYTEYQDGSSTRGVVSEENFLFGEGQNVDDIIFGCAVDNRDFDDLSDTAMSGIMGLYNSPDSLIHQLANIITPRFSYCFVPLDELQPGSGALRFGDDIPPLPPNVQTTGFATVPGISLYHLNLLDISVGTTRLGFAPSQFRVRRDGSGGCIIDSGTTFSMIDQRRYRGRNAYAEVMALFREYYDARNFEREVRVIEDMELCYKHRPGFNDFATITYHFEHADYHVDSRYAHFPDDLNQEYFCIPIFPSNGISMLGGWHQQNMRIIYDLDINVLQFAPEICLNDIL